MRKELLFTILVSIAFVFLQAFWIVRMYQRYEEQYTAQINEAFLHAIEKEADRGGYKGDTIDFALLKQKGIVHNVSELLSQLEQDESLSNRRLPELPVIDSLLREDLSGLKINHYLSLYDKEGKIVDSLGNTSLRGKSQVIKIREVIGTKGLFYMQIEFKLPYDAILSRMFYSLVVFTLIIVVVVGCLIHQLRVISQKDELLERREVSVNGIVHDLKSPLNALVTLTGWLMETESDLRKKELMAEVIKRAGHQAAQIESILVCARGTAQPIVLNKTEINPEEIVQAAIDDICVELKAKPHSIEVINEAPGLTCPADRGYLENVMKNLIENALKYADDGVKIQIEITKISQGIQIKVIDNGWGIAPKYQKKLFNQYYQVPREALRMQKGYGIGLAYVRHIIRRMVAKSNSRAVRMKEVYLRFIFRKNKVWRRKLKFFLLMMILRLDVFVPSSYRKKATKSFIRLL